MHNTLFLSVPHIHRAIAITTIITMYYAYIIIIIIIEGIVLKGQILRSMKFKVHGSIVIHAAFTTTVTH